MLPWTMSQRSKRHFPMVVERSIGFKGASVLCLSERGWLPGRIEPEPGCGDDDFCDAGAFLPGADRRRRRMVQDRKRASLCTCASARGHRRCRRHKPRRNGRPIGRRPVPRRVQLVAGYASNH